MRVSLLRAGDRGILIEVDGPDEVLALDRALRDAALPEVEDAIPAARTVLVRTIADVDEAGLREVLVRLIEGLPAGSREGSAGESPLVRIPVVYDGVDLADVAAATGLDPAGVVAAHTGTEWRAAFAGFAPGFCYLSGGDPRLLVPRRDESRTRVPAGAVALAGGYSAVYPRESPGGWQLIGTTAMPMWDLESDHPARITPGARVRFVRVPG